jgi:hypothetical protein
MRRLGTVLGLVGVVAVGLVACGRGQAPIPAGAQQVHVVIAGSTVRLDPDTVPAGDVYVVLDTPGSGEKRGRVPDPRVRQRAYGHAPLDYLTNWLQDRERVGLSWWFAWPCYGYTQVWLPWLFRHQDTHTIEIDFDRLSPETRQDLERLDVDLDDPAPG